MSEHARARAAVFIFVLSIVPHLVAQDGDALPLLVHTMADQQQKSLFDLYCQLHARPEIAGEEKNTAARLAKEFKSAGCTVTAGVAGHGVVAVLKNGTGPTVLVRIEMDALPGKEKTGLPYAATKDHAGAMHASGHDIHMAVAVGAMRNLHGLVKSWQGTVIIVAQPASETGAGAKAMLDAGLFKKWPRPDTVLAFQVDPNLEVGKIGFTSGPAFAHRDRVRVIIKGVGGPAARPQEARDAILLASRFVLDLQTIVTREIDPAEPALISVGAIHGGSDPDRIADEVQIELTLRCFDDGVRETLLSSIKRRAQSLARSADVPEDRLPLVVVEKGHIPSVSNDAGLTKQMIGAFSRFLGLPFLVLAPVPPDLNAEDFAHIARQMPRGQGVFTYRLGTALPETLTAAQKPGAPPVPPLGSPLYAPVPNPTINTGVRALTGALLELLPKN